MVKQIVIMKENEQQANKQWQEKGYIEGTEAVCTNCQKCNVNGKCKKYDFVILKELGLIQEV